MFTGFYLRKPVKMGRASLAPNFPKPKKNTDLPACELDGQARMGYQDETIAALSENLREI